jgi:hypothetical protein
MSQADNVQTANRRDRGCAATQKNRSCQSFFLMEYVRRGATIGLETDHDTDRHSEEARQENQDQDASDGRDQTHEGSLSRG